MAHGWMKAALITLLVASANCTSHHDGRAGWAQAIDLERDMAPKAMGRAPVILMTIDGARWQEIFQGEDPVFVHGPRRSPAEIMPNLHRLATERGALVGAPGRGVMRATGPNFISLPGYNEILSGRSPLACQDNDCAPASSPTVLDEAYADGAKVAAFASWEKLARAVTVAPGRFDVSCGRAGDPAINPWPGGGDFRPDALTAQLALRYLANEHPDVLYLGLGEPDEYAHMTNYPGYLKALSFADAVLGQIFVTLDRMGDVGARTNVFVTVDHGRGKDFRGHGSSYPESSRVWMFAAGPDIAARGLVASNGEHRLADVAPTLRVLMGLDPDPSTHAGAPIRELLGGLNGTANLAAVDGTRTEKSEAQRL